MLNAGHYANQDELHTSIITILVHIFNFRFYLFFLKDSSAPDQKIILLPWGTRFRQQYVIMKTYCSTPATMGNKDLSTHDCSTKMTIHHSLQDYSPKSFISWTYHFWMSIFRQFMAFGISIFWQIFDLVKNISIQISDFWLAMIYQIVVFPISLINHLYIWWLVFVGKIWKYFLCQNSLIRWSKKCHMPWVTVTSFTETFNLWLIKLPLIYYLVKLKLTNLDSLWPSDAIWWQKSGSTLVQVMAWCLTPSSHYLNQCWLIVSDVQWHSY